MRSTKYDPPAPGGKPPSYPEQPPQPYENPGDPRPYLYRHHPPGPKKFTAKHAWIVFGVIFVVIIIPMGFIALFSLWLEDISYSSEQWDESIDAELRQGDGNLESGCLFTLKKVDEGSVWIYDYSFKIGEEDGIKYTLIWSTQGNKTASNIDSGLIQSDELWWDEDETLGFDAPSGLTGLEYGDRIQVQIVNRRYDEIVFEDEFFYKP